MKTAAARGVLGLLLLLSAGIARAETPTAVEVAERAATAHEAHCSDVAAGKATAAAEALARVGPVLAEVSRSYDASGEPFLLYWRGMLNQCLDQEDRAASDLAAFVKAAAAWPVYAEQVTEAKRRLRGLLPATGTTKNAAGPAPGGIVAGASLLGAGAVFGGLSGWQGSKSAVAQADWDAGLQPYDDLATIQQDGQDAADASNGLLAGAIGFGLGGLAAFVITASTSGSNSPRAASALPTAWPLPDGGAALGLVGRW